MRSTDQLIHIFNEAKARATEEEQWHYIEEACASNPEMKEQVISLLQADAEAQGFMRAAPLGGLDEADTEKPGNRIGRYKLLQQIGEGGCGVVYMAEQEEPVRRQVALKVIKLGMDTRSVVARFEAERQALALMDHPNIAKVLDAGATDVGRPYFVMELVRGPKITEHCNQNSLSVEERLKLFIQVCEAIEHAHQKGIIHRDIKPSNILVTEEKGLPGVPKVIDFGIAKATTGQSLTDKTIFTAVEQFMGTPAYMSPEQALLTSTDIDTRTDIYSLGVLLYELLTGRPPFDPGALLACGIDEMRQTIREREPERPSARVSIMPPAEFEAVTRERHSDRTKLIRDLQGDLDWIVLKALEKEPTRRYETASSLVADVQRHLNDEPVLAFPPNRTYRLRKTVRRHAGLVLALSAAILILFSGIATSMVLLFRENAAMRRAIVAEETARRERLATEAVTRSIAKSGTSLLEHGDLEAAEKFLSAALTVLRELRQDGEKEALADVLSAMTHISHSRRDYVQVVGSRID